MLVGVAVKLQGAACVIVKFCGPTLMVPVREVVPVFGAAVY